MELEIFPGFLQKDYCQVIHLVPILKEESIATSPVHKSIIKETVNGYTDIDTNRFKNRQTKRNL